MKKSYFDNNSLFSRLQEQSVKTSEVLKTSEVCASMKVFFVRMQQPWLQALVRIARGDVPTQERRNEDTREIEAEQIEDSFFSYSMRK